MARPLTACGAQPRKICAYGRRPSKKKGQHPCIAQPRKKLNRGGCGQAHLINTCRNIRFQSVSRFDACRSDFFGRLQLRCIVQNSPIFLYTIGNMSQERMLLNAKNIQRCQAMRVHKPSACLFGNTDIQDSRIRRRPRFHLIHLMHRRPKNKAPYRWM